MKKVLWWVGGILVGLFILGSLMQRGNSSSPSPAADTVAVVTVEATTTAEASEPTTTNENVDATMGPRTRAFVDQLRSCQKIVRALAALLEYAGSIDSVQLATDAAGAKNICENARDNMGGSDNTHFSDQALDAEVAIDDYISGIKKIADYIDTSTPSDIPAATEKLQAATGEAAAAIDEINERRQLYGFGNI